MITAVVVVEDGSLAMRGAIETLRDSDLSVLLGVFGGVNELPVPAQAVVLLVDPFGCSAIDLSQLAGAPKPYMTLVMSARTHIDAVRYALQIGARGFISKETSASTLLDAISAVSLGGIYLASPLDGMLFDNDGDCGVPPVVIPADGLTPRERDVLIMVAQGLTHKQIATKLSLSKATVDTYVQRVRQKVGSGNKAGLTRLAIDLGMVSETAATRPHFARHINKAPTLRL
jgi:two-component system, NarL family, nitrate/nitrite response regulator NarL